jgi:predicted house-cleaning NTP pyrophosphatase (Maf/HAM1 superfamily)
MTHMPTTVPRQILLASGSEIRAMLLRNAGLVIDARPARL